MNLAGKDYFTVREAAEYACISLSQWRARVQPAFPPGLFFGKLIYRRTDVQRFVETQARWPGQPLSQHPTARLLVAPELFARLEGTRQRAFVPRKKLSPSDE
jgi:hypothetical protein